MKTSRVRTSGDVMAVISVKICEPQFEGQTKTKLGNSEVRPLVDGALADGLRRF